MEFAVAAKRLGIAVECPQEHCAGAVVGRAWTDQPSHIADHALEAELRTTGRWMRRITGYSPTTPHREPGWGLQPWAGRKPKSATSESASSRTPQLLEAAQLLRRMPDRPTNPVQADAVPERGPQTRENLRGTKKVAT
jgi:hypothetical protein